MDTLSENLDMTAWKDESFGLNVVSAVPGK